jgi:diguanylate cyclase (GGDEF)-like protein/PAS domain S-box-containing protein
LRTGNSMLKWLRAPPLLASLRARLLVIFMGVIGLAIVPALLMESAQREAIQAMRDIVNTDMQVSELALRSVAVFGRARRQEQEFLLYYPDLGFKEARDRHAVQVATSIAELNANLAEIARVAEHEPTRETVARTTRAADEYLSAFKAMVDLREAVSTPHRGLGARLEQSAAEFFAALPYGPQIRLVLLDVQPAVLELATDATEAAHAQLGAALSRVDHAPEVLRLRGPARDAVMQDLDELRQRANELRDIGVRIEESRSAYTKAAQLVEPQLDELHLGRVRETRDSLAGMLEREGKAHRDALIVELFAVALALVLAGWIASRVARHIGAFVAHTEQIAAGRFDATPPETGTTEFQALERALAAMSARLRDSVAAIEARSTQLDDINQSLSREVDERIRAEQELREREAQMALLLASTGEAIYGVDTDGRCTFCNRAFLRTLGYDDESEVLGRNAHELMRYIHSDGSTATVDGFPVYGALRTGASAHRDDAFLSRTDGSIFAVEYWCHPLRRGGEQVGAVITFIDITARREADAQTRRDAALDRLLEQLATVANQAQSSADGMRTCLRLICDFTGWAVGHAALTAADGPYRVAKVDFWHTAQPERFESFITQSTGYRFKLTSGLIAQVFATKAPIWIAELSQPGVFGRMETMSRSGLVSGIGLPVLVRGEVLGFLEFFTTERAQADPVLMSALARAGGQLGRLVERTALEAQLLILNTDLERRIVHRTAELKQANDALVRGNQEVVLLSEMTNLLQSALGFEEAAVILKQFLREVFAPHSGAVYLMRASLNRADLFVQWGDTHSPAEFSNEDCWALRRGQMYVVENPQLHIACRHAAGVERPYACIPMMAHGIALGLLHVVFDREGLEGTLTDREAHAARVANQLAMALANLKLRESLREQSIRDPLTGLFNRRYLLESLEREIARAAREIRPLAVIMLDVDHFKRYNDQHGHEAGDNVLRAVGAILANSARTGDIACRFGGEEFTMVLAGATAAQAREWAERTLGRLRRSEVRFEGRALPAVTASMGLAIYPGHGASGETLLQAADVALYEAKRAGRDRFVVAEGEAENGLTP